MTNEEFLKSITLEEVFHAGVHHVNRGGGGDVVESFEYSFHLPVVQLVLFLDSYEHGIIHVVRRLFLPLLLRLYQ